MHERNKKIFKHISSTWQKETYFGFEIARWLAPKGEAAFCFDIKNNSCHLLHKGNGCDEELNILTELLSYLDYAEENHLIYVTEDGAITLDTYVLYENVTNCRLLQKPDHYDIGNDKVLRKEGDRYCILDEKNGKEELESSTDISYLYERLKHYLFAHVYSTRGLKDFIGRRYLSRQDFFSNVAICVSTISIVLTILTAILSPFLSVCISNKHGYTKIEKKQYVKFTEGIKRLDAIDSLVRTPIVIRDTIKIKEVKSVKTPAKEENK